MPRNLLKQSIRTPMRRGGVQEALADYESETEDFKAEYADFEYAVEEGRCLLYTSRCV